MIDYSAMQLILRRHVFALLRTTLLQLGHCDTRRFNTGRPGSAIRLPRIVLMRLPGQLAKGDDRSPSAPAISTRQIAHAMICCGCSAATG